MFILYTIHSDLYHAFLGTYLDHVFAFFSPKEAKTATPGRGERELLESRIFVNLWKSLGENHWGVLEFWVVWNIFFVFDWFFLGGTLNCIGQNKFSLKHITTNHREIYDSFWFYELFPSLKLRFSDGFVLRNVFHKNISEANCNKNQSTLASSEYPFAPICGHLV